MLEIADGQFSEVRARLDEVDRRRAEETEAAVSARPIDADSLTRFLETSPAERIENAARTKGFTMTEPTERLGSLQAVCEALNISTIGELESLVEGAVGKADQYFQQLYQEAKVSRWLTSRAFVVAQIVMFSKANDLPDGFLAQVEWQGNYGQLALCVARAIAAAPSNQ